jgi:hypothetical protein
MYLTLCAIIASFSLAIISDRDASSSCPVRIKAFFIVFLAFRLIPAKAVDRFSTVCSISVRSRI